MAILAFFWDLKAFYTTASNKRRKKTFSFFFSILNTGDQKDRNENVPLINESLLR